MQIIEANYIYTPNGYIKNMAVAFKDKILEIDKLSILSKKYPDAHIYQTGKNSILYPGFVNAHTHLEFSANKTTLKYGDFINWLGSVIENRESLLDKVSNQDMSLACNEMLESGITTFGAISSFGFDLEVCRKTPQKVLYFNEAIGSQPAVLDVLYQDFISRSEASKEKAEKYKIIPAVGIHSPYSIHPIMAKKVIEYAKSNEMVISCHFMESAYEREWLDRGKGRFMEFFAKYFKGEKSNKLEEIFIKYADIIKPLTTAQDFIKMFDDYPSLFVHAVHSLEEEIKYLQSQKHSIVHSPRSNRYLGVGRLKIEDIYNSLIVATDGLSSNNSLNIFDELRSALMMHYHLPIKELSDRLIEAITVKPAQALRVDCGKIEVGFSADFALINLPDDTDEEYLSLHTILHTKRVSRLWIDGTEIIFA